MFQPVDTNVSFPKLEEQVLEWWEHRQIIAQSLQSGDPARPFVFFEGPPTANGRPGFHHIISRSFKDIILRFRAMQGYHIVGRREGWDTHGLPVEIEVEKELGFSGKPDIERYGIAEFNARCRDSVWRYIQDWKKFSQRIAFWLSEDAYITYENRYIETLWWVFKQLWERNLLYRDYKVTMHCPRCGTSLSDHEVSMGFQDNVDDPSVWIRFRVRPASAGTESTTASAHPLADTLAGSSFIAWTTTPWTLPANVALAIKPDADYALVEYSGPHAHTDGAASERLLLANELLPRVLGEEHVSVVATYAGRDLVGLRYAPLYQGVPGPGDTVNLADAYQVIGDDFVSLTDGSGVVHIAPAYGDLEIGRRYGLPTLFSVDLSGKLMEDFPEADAAGTFFKDADKDITRNLKQRGLLLKSERIRHAYPFCWRDGTPLLYYAKTSWYIRTTAVKEQLIKNNQQIHWVPEHVRDGRFGNWLENNIDWAISRERYWGTPMPIWISADGAHMECIGSVAELEAKVGRSLADLDLHRPYVDDLTWEAPDGHGTMRRIPDVADVWYDSGGMQVAQWHYPFENEAIFAQAHPANYICEAVDQTRGWFYTLHALGTLLFDRPAFLNVICLGHILDAEGFKMSKSRGNTINPWMVFRDYGVDALRWSLFSDSPPGNPRRFSLNQVAESMRQFMLTFWNTYAFFVTYANLDGWQPDRDAVDVIRATSHEQPIDHWALSSVTILVRDVTASLEDYDVLTAARAIEAFVDDLSNWYVRRNRRRFWKSETDTDKQAAYHTLYTCLVTVTKLMAPFVPFVSDAIYRNLVGSVAPDAPESVHLAQWPTVNPDLIDEQLATDTKVLHQVVSLGRAARKNASIKIRQPLGELWVRAATPEARRGLERFEDTMRDELNIKTVRYFDASTDFVDYRCKPNLPVVGRKHRQLVPAIKAALEGLSNEQARDIAHAVEAGRAFSLEVQGQPMHMEADEVLIETTSPEGYAVAEDGGALVALNTTLTPELRIEGMARDLVRNVQDARKNAGLDISDRIVLYLISDADDEDSRTEEVISTWGDYIREETLASRLVHGAALPAGAHTEKLDMDGEQVAVGIVKA